METNNPLIISPSELKRNLVINRKIIIHKKNDTLISGTLVDNLCKPLIGAVIVIKKIDTTTNPPSTKSVYYLLTNSNGDYAFIADCDPCIIYNIEVFTPLIKE